MSDFQPLVESNRRLTETVENKVGEIDQRVEQAEEEYRNLINGIRSDFPFYRLTKNQELKINGALTVGSTGTPDGWANRSSAIHQCEIVAYSQTGVEPDQKDPIVQEMWMHIKGYVPKHNQPDFAILRVSTVPDAAPNEIRTFYSIYQGPLPNGVPMTFGAWIKVESGDVRFLSSNTDYQVPSDNRWHEITKTYNMSNGGADYTFGPHLYIEPGASCLIALPAVVVGKIPDGKWGFVDKPILEREG
ncbi:hypothetical protein ACLIOE_003795 [Vibrio parahaemolyticus]|uniref:hypothetical protein n=1 Tax=Vibrio parahaemolyticus TaxID=670 RepID=UPI0013B8820D|nr:hypothetical protein [Vibrio parahaemolyticus]NEU19207.1 hypothetical protein [Vibrio parahaemolyticus]